ncbi:hypothetical protein [Synechococcus sp. A18-25c]|uniref:hypothetical protein n=1 Tax=Synechococcus sp. A18-25c TaxID=1866938 RepID=UPI00164976FF|nr:hypothetical protein [Synechococcus sp. A18-25c]
MHRSAWNATEQRQAIANAGLAVLRAIAHEESRSLDSPRCGVEVGASDVAIDDAPSKLVRQVCERFNVGPRGLEHQ